MQPNSSTGGSSTICSAKLTVLVGGLTIGEAAVTTDDFTLGSGNLTLNVEIGVAPWRGRVFTATGVQPLSASSVHMDERVNKVASIRARYGGTGTICDQDRA